MATARRTTSIGSSVQVKGSPTKTPCAHGEERRVVTPRADLVVIKIGDRYAKISASSKERAADVLARVGKVMSKPGANRKRVFRSASGKSVYAYSVDPKDTTKVVRENAAGQRTVGRLVSGRFRAFTSARTI